MQLIQIKFLIQKHMKLCNFKKLINIRIFTISQIKLLTQNTFYKLISEISQL